MQGEKLKVVFLVKPSAFEFLEGQFGVGRQSQGIGDQLTHRINFVGVGFVIENVNNTFANYEVLMLPI